MPGRLVQLDLPYNFPVEYQQHIRDHTKHEDLDTHHDKEYGQDGEGDVIDMTQPFKGNVYTGKNTKDSRKNPHDTKIEQGIVDPASR